MIAKRFACALGSHSILNGSLRAMDHGARLLQDAVMRNGASGWITGFSKRLLHLGPKPTVMRRCFVRSLHGRCPVRPLPRGFGLMWIPVARINLGGDDSDLTQQPDGLIEAGKAPRFFAAGCS